MTAAVIPGSGALPSCALCCSTHSHSPSFTHSHSAFRLRTRSATHARPLTSAAAGNFLAPISGMSENAFRTVIEIDMIGTYNTLKATLPSVRETKGAYLHISATLHYSGTPYQAHVSAAKAAIDALSNVIAVEEGPRGVRSNVVAPG